MTDSPSTSSSSGTKPGPANPQAEGLDEPTPPGGPLRQDGKGEGPLSEGHDDEASASRTNDKHASESGGGTIAIEDEQSRPAVDSDESEDQEENAESSLDQPSEG
ncbi:MAG: hypothetical protein ABWX73_05515 [Marmoricola sp.]